MRHPWSYHSHLFDSDSSLINQCKIAKTVSLIPWGKVSLKIPSVNLQVVRRILGDRILRNVLKRDLQSNRMYLCSVSVFCLHSSGCTLHSSPANVILAPYNRSVLGNLPLAEMDAQSTCGCLFCHSQIQSSKVWNRDIASRFT